MVGNVLPGAATSTSSNEEGLGRGAKIGLGIGALGLGILSANRANYGTENAPPSGYQGVVPDYTLVRENVLDTYNKDRVPGSRGQRYFSDFRFVPTGFAQQVQGGINVTRNPAIDTLRQDLFNQANVGPDSLRAQNYARVGQTAPDLPEGAGPTGIDSVLGFPPDRYGMREDPTDPEFTPTDPEEYQVFEGGNIYVPGYGMVNVYDETSIANFIIWREKQAEAAETPDPTDPDPTDPDPTDPDPADPTEPPKYTDVNDFRSNADLGSYFADPAQDGRFLVRSLDGVFTRVNSEEEAKRVSQLNATAFAGADQTEGYFAEGPAGSYIAEPNGRGFIVLTPDYKYEDLPTDRFDRAAYPEMLLVETEEEAKELSGSDEAFNVGAEFNTWKANSKVGDQLTLNDGRFLVKAQDGEITAFFNEEAANTFAAQQRPDSDDSQPPSDDNQPPSDDTTQPPPDDSQPPPDDTSPPTEFEQTHGLSEDNARNVLQYMLFGEGDARPSDYPDIPTGSGLWRKMAQDLGITDANGQLVTPDSAVATKNDDFKVTISPFPSPIYVPNKFRSIPSQSRLLVQQEAEYIFRTGNPTGTAFYRSVLNDPAQNGYLNYLLMYYGQQVSANPRPYGDDVRAGKKGGIISLMGGGYLDGPTDGMADQINATIEGTQPAALSDGEFVVPADVVSHLGNGNSDAGAKQLYAMMKEIRKARTGTTRQGKQINPNQYLPRGIA